MHESWTFEVVWELSWLHIPNTRTMQTLNFMFGQHTYIMHSSQILHV